MSDDNARYGIVADLMAKGEAVAEGYLYGSEAVHLIKSKLVSRETMTAYRSSAYFQRLRMYGEVQAKQWEEERKALHTSCWESYDEVLRQRKEIDDRKMGRNQHQGG